MSGSTPAGWYDNPSGEDLRYWDGSHWTDHYHEKRDVAVPDVTAPKTTSTYEGEWDPEVVWQATGKPLTGIGAGRYKLTKFYLFFEKGTLRTNAQQAPVASLMDIDVRQSMSQKARGVGNVIVHIQRATGMEVVVLEDIPNFREGQLAINEVAAAARAHLRRAENTNTVNYQGAAPFAPTANPVPHAIEQATVEAVDYVAQLERLGRLRDGGVLTEDEFQAKKVELLRRI